MLRNAVLLEAVQEILAAYNFKPTIRQVYYRLVSPPYQLMENTRSAYTGFDHQMVKAREQEDIDPRAFAENSRSLQGGEDSAFDLPMDFLEVISTYSHPENYHKKMWTNQPRIVEVWVEKDALASIVAQAVEPYHVLVFPTRGYCPFTKLHEAVERFNTKPTVLLDLRDHDPSGLDMSRDIRERVARYGGEFGYMRLALNYDQAKDLPPNPTKELDTKAKAYKQQFGDRCWELDALPPDELQRLIVSALDSLIDKTIWEADKGQEARERESLGPILAQAREVLGGKG